ncbi:MAG: hypothetical protein M1831_002528 [Alyxoria varia]|nr:MAG: hypothetical protein M1831_002528 [Alyxoria varia]
MANMQSLLSSPEYSDLTLCCEGQNFLVHRALVCPRSPVITAAVTGAFQEAHTRQLEVTIADVDTLKRVLEYLYTGDYNDQDDEADCTNNSLPPGFQFGQHARRNSTHNAFVPRSANDVLNNNAFVYITADYYQITELMNLAVVKFRKASENFSLDNFSSVIDIVYDYTPESATELRFIVLSCILKNAKQCMADQALMEAMAAMPNFTKDMMPAMVSGYEETIKRQAGAISNNKQQIATANESIVDLRQKLNAANTMQINTNNQLNAANTGQINTNNQLAQVLQREANLVGGVNAANKCKGCRERVGVYISKEGESGWSLHCSCDRSYGTFTG